MSRRILCVIAAIGTIGSCLVAGRGAAADWGSVKGKFVYEGKPKVEAINVTKDPEYCVPQKPMVETVEVGEGGGLENVFVYLYLARGKTVEINPDFKPQDLKPAVLDNKGCRFQPHAMTVWTAQEFEVHNSDPGIGHNTNGQAFAENTGFNETVTNDKPLVKKFQKSEPRPQEISCNVHPWMHAYVLIRDNPYMALSGSDGSFEIKNLPAGKQSLVIWHETKGFLRDLKVGDKKTDRKGQFEVTVPAGSTLDLGEIKVSTAALGQ